jgi:hypothetical protein
MNVCESCGGAGPQVVYGYCTECVEKHTRRELPLGVCAGCDILGNRQAALEEEKGETPAPGA